LKNIRTGRVMSVQAPVFFLARERNLAEEAWPGDIIGIPNHGSLRIGDTLTEGEPIRITGIPSATSMAAQANSACWGGQRIDDSQPDRPGRRRFLVPRSAD
jgi:peptide subunit release factor RF-3